MLKSIDTTTKLMIEYRLIVQFKYFIQLYLSTDTNQVPQVSHGYATRRCEQHNRKIGDNCSAGHWNAGYSIMNLDAPPEQSAQAPNGMPLRQCVPNTSSDLAINIELLHLRVLPRFYGLLYLLVVGYLCSGGERLLYTAEVCCIL